MKNTISSFNIADIYIILWCVYLHQSTFFSSELMVFQLLLVLILGMSIYFIVCVVTKYKTPQYFKGLGWFLGFVTVYGFIQFISGEKLIIRNSGYIVSSYNYLKLILISMLPIYSFYFFGRRGYINERKITIYSIVFVLLALASFYSYQAKALLDRVAADEYEITNNIGYVFVSIIPFVYLLKKDFLKYILFAVCVIFTLLSFKRGAILVSVFAIVIFLLGTLKRARRWTKIIIYLSIIAIGICLYYLVNDLLQNNAYFQIRLEDTLSGDSSNREDYYGGLWNHFLNDSNIINQLFGNGAFATLKFSANYAHSDWLEILIDHGLVGCALYIFYWIMFYKTWKVARKKVADNNCFATTILLVMVIYFLKSIFSMSYFDMTIYATFALGYSLSMVNDNTSLPRTHSCNIVQNQTEEYNK